MFKLTISTTNDAFGPADYDRNEEVARILRDAADRLSSGQDYGPTMDVNGNTTGAFGFVREEGSGS